MSCLNQLFKVFLIFLVLTGTASAADFGIVSALSDGISQGFDKILVSVTDQSYENMGMNTTESSTMLTNFMIQPNDFLK